MSLDIEISTTIVRFSVLVRGRSGIQKRPSLHLKHHLLVYLNYPTFSSFISTITPSSSFATTVSSVKNWIPWLHDEWWSVDQNTWPWQLRFINVLAKSRRSSSSFSPGTSYLVLSSSIWRLTLYGGSHSRRSTDSTSFCPQTAFWSSLWSRKTAS